MYLLHDFVFISFLLAGCCYGEYCHTAHDCHLTSCAYNRHIACYKNDCVCYLQSACSTNPCHNHGTCQPSTHQPYYSCQCRAGWTGLHCESTYCSSDTCQNGGQCTRSLHQPYYHCHCPHNYHGTHCEQNMCSSNPCHSNGNCQPSTQHPYYSCQCHDGWTGQRCDENMCYSKPCQNSGVCHQYTIAPYYYCNCHHSGWTGLNCTNTYCESNPCGQGQTCVTQQDQPYYRCTCPHNHYGTQCEHRICSHRSCNNGGTCVPNSQTNHYTCTCLPGYSGNHCQDHNVSVTTTPTPLTTTKSTVTQHPPSVHITDVPYDPNHGPYCLTCDDVVSPNTCEYVARCGPHEICSVDSFVTSSGVVRYNLGCKDAQQCPSTKRDVNSSQSEDASTITVCSECCQEHLCNSGGCGVNGFTQKTTADRGPVCFHCDQENSPADCSKVAVCGRDEVCAVTHTKVATTQQILWKSWCMHTSECIQDLNKNMNNTAVQVFNVNNKYGGLRSDGHCWFMCCLHDLCNRRCADTSAPLYTSLIG